MVLVVMSVSNSEGSSSFEYLFTHGCIHLGGACGTSHLRMHVHVHMGGDCSKERGIPGKHNKLQGLLDPLHPCGFAALEGRRALDWYASYLAKS